MKGHDKVWLARRIDIARHWKETYPAYKDLFNIKRMIGEEI